MTTPSIVVSPSCGALVNYELLQAGVKPQRSLCMRVLRKNSKNAPSAALTPTQQDAELGPDDTRRSRSPSPSAKRKEMPSPHSLKRKYLRKVKLSPMPHLSFGKGRKASSKEAASAATPSSFEEELAGRENQSPNDPEFLRRASERWKRRTGAGQLQPPLQFSQNTAALQPTFHWPSSPTQQSAFQRRVSPRPVHYSQSPFQSIPTSPNPGTPSFRRCNTQYSSLSKANTETPFKRSSHSYTSLSSLARSHVGLGTGDQAPTNSPKLTRPAMRTTKYLAPSGPGVGGAPQLFCGRLSFDDTVVEELKKLAKKEQLSIPDNSSGKAPLRRLSARLSRPSRSGKYSINGSNVTSNCNSNIPSTNNTLSNNSKNHDNNGIRRNKTLSTISSSNSIGSIRSFYCNDSTPVEVSSFTSSTSSQSFVSYSSGYLSAPSSPATAPRQMTSPMNSRRALGNTDLAKRVTFHDIFIEEPQLAEKFAIMFPTEPRPEWHRHLRQVLNKAGQKIFKKSESHDTTIPENLRHQLKHIYVY
ncbi:uncharacterized protein LOC126982878 isoform X1 [Eriocheir sinensis]|uniref:uncharacterized protein LOC126982878 isoform X1 n=1 Tax=Eriocheir sinensis TaxID=95602 RepID=UPI0021C85E4C|nr:uncharacterized protein LOC126982878 isoform X1 [Eriocheir sinensis]